MSRSFDCSDTTPFILESEDELHSLPLPIDAIIKDVAVPNQNCYIGPGGGVPLNSVHRGTDDLSRVGNQTRGVFLDFNYMVSTHNTNNKPYWVRIMIVNFRNSNSNPSGALVYPPPLWDLTIDPVTQTHPIYAQYDPERMSNFEILYDKMVFLKPKYNTAFQLNSSVSTGTLEPQGKASIASLGFGGTWEGEVAGTFEGFTGGGEDITLPSFSLGANQTNYNTVQHQIYQIDSIGDSISIDLDGLETLFTGSTGSAHHIQTNSIMLYCCCYSPLPYSATATAPRIVGSSVYRFYDS